jgi:rifampicin phosphotransferase
MPRFWIGLLLLLLTEASWAIPAPDLVINLFASVAQLTGLAVAGLGALALRLGFKKRGHGRGQAAWLLPVLVGLVALLALGNLAQYLHQLSQKSQRIEAALWRKPADWARDFEAPQITAAALAEKLVSAHPPLIVDVREPEEFEVAHLHQAQNFRYADLLLGLAAPQSEPQNVPTPAQRDLVFVCDSGKRSGEVCEKFRKDGQACEVLEGGYPRWAMQGRPLWLASSGWRARFASLPRFPGDTTYLDTAAVSELVAQQAALFVDVRSPAEFALGHLPGAVNLPMRGLASPDLKLRLDGLAHQPYIAACYDNRSCFHAKVLGLKLVRAGHDFLGRYTLAHEYPVPAQIQTQSVSSRLQRAVSRGLDYAIRPLASVLHELAQAIGSLPPVLLMLLLVTRLPFMPVPGKKPSAGNDTTSAGEHARQLAQLHHRYGNDQLRLLRALKQWRRKTGQTPWRNLGLALLQMLIFFVCYAAVRANADWVNESFLWIPELSEPDPLGLLSVSVGVLGFAALRHLLPGQAQGWARFYGLLHLAGAFFLIYASWHLAAATVLYLAASLLLLCLQQQGRNLLVLLHRVRNALGLRKVNPGKVLKPWVAIKKATEHGQHGGKAVGLAVLAQAGFSVPQAWVLPARELDVLFGIHPIGSPGQTRASDEIWKAIEKTSPLQPGLRYAVRSSARQEDGSHHSFAGVFHTELNVQPGNLKQALRAVWQSYQQAQSSGGVLVQVMVPANYSGVLFTRNPANHATLLIECVAGLADVLMDGSAAPMSFEYGRLSGHLYSGGPPPPLPLQQLLSLGLQVEAHFGQAQDIEWAWADGRFCLLQSRNITSRALTPNGSAGALLVERDRLAVLLQPFVGQTAQRDLKPHEIMLEQTDLSAELPHPTALSLDLLQRLRAEGGSTDLAMEHLGLDFQVHGDSPNEVQTAFGSTYILKPQARRNMPGIGAWAAYGLSRRAGEIETGFVEDFLPTFNREMVWRNAVNFKGMAGHELVTTFSAWMNEFQTRHYLQADIINIAAEFYNQTAIRALEAKKLPLRLLRLNRPAGRPALSLANYGHRSLMDWELAEPRFAEAPTLFDDWRKVLERAEHPENVVDSIERQHKVGATLQRLCVRAQKFAELKEIAKNECLKPLLPLRRLLLELDTRFELAGLIFHLVQAEIESLPSRAAALKIIATQRQNTRTALFALQPDAKLRLMDIEMFANPAFKSKPPRPDPQPGSLTGTWVAGEAEVSGRVRLVRDAADAQQLQPGEIAVVQLASPQWHLVFDRAGGLISEVGGSLSHLAVLAREHGTPCIFGCSGAMQFLHNGQLVCLRDTGEIELL